MLEEIGFLLGKMIAGDNTDAATELFKNTSDFEGLYKALKGEEYSDNRKDSVEVTEQESSRRHGFKEWASKFGVDMSL